MSAAAAAAMPSFQEHLAQQPSTMMVYVGALLLLLWVGSLFHLSSFWIFLLAFLFLFEVDLIYSKRLRREMRSKERRSALQGRPLTDFESADWINQAIEKMWPIFLERLISEHILTPMVPWFLDKHKPWTVRSATLVRLNLGRSPPIFTGARTLKKAAGDDDLVMDMCLDFAGGENMEAVLSVQIRRRLGLGIRTNIHISRLHVEGKVRVAVKVSNKWPFLKCVRLCFENAPYVQMTARPVSTHGLNVSEVPIIAGWMERMVADVFEQSLVEPNMLVLDIDKLISCVSPWKVPDSSMQGNWFEIQEKAAIATVHLKILRAKDLKPSDPNGLADPFVRGSFTTCRFKTAVQWKTLNPQWLEEFEVPIASWELPTLLVLRVRDKDTFRDDDLGFCEIDVAKFRDGNEHELWIPLQNVKMGRLNIALRITDSDSGSVHEDVEATKLSRNDTDDVDENFLTSDRFEAINLGKGTEGFLSVVSPGKTSRTRSWQQRQGTKRRESSTNLKDIREALHLETLDSSSSDEGSAHQEGERTKTKPRKKSFWSRRQHRPIFIGTIQNENLIPENGHDECLGRGHKGTTVSVKLEEPSESVGGEGLLDDNDNAIEQGVEVSACQDSSRIPESPSKRDQMKNIAKGIIKQAGKTAHNLSNAFIRKGSNKRTAEIDDSDSLSVRSAPLSVTESHHKECPSDTELMDDISVTDQGNESFNNDGKGQRRAEENVNQPNVIDPLMNVDTVL